jgi:hypothetical protein
MHKRKPGQPHKGWKAAARQMRITCLDYSESDPWREECCKLNMRFALPRCANACGLLVAPTSREERRMSEPSVDDLIVSELHTAYKNLGGTRTDHMRTAWQSIDAVMCWNPPVDLRYILGSYKDTLDDSEILNLLREWNRTGKVIHQPQ